MKKIAQKIEAIIINLTGKGNCTNESDFSFKIYVIVKRKKEDP